MKIIKILVLITFCIFSYNTKECKHDEYMKKFNEKRLKPQEIIDNYLKTYEYETNDNKRVLNDYTPSYLGIGSKPAPIRITPVYQLDNIDQQFHRVIKDSIEVSLQYLRDVLYVFPEIEPIVVTDTGMNNGHEGLCIEAAKKDYYEILQGYTTTGFSDTDLVLIVGAFTEKDSTTLAYAGACQWHHDRATVGRIIFETGWYSDVYNADYGGDFEESVETTLHEIIHVLGFSQNLYPYFRTSLGKRMHPTYGWSKYQVKELVRDVKRTVLRTPLLQKYTKEHFGCEGLTGPFIEDEGGDGSAGSHWEQSMFINELMQPQNIQSDSVTSIFTLAFLKDSNWYADVDLSFSENLQWGKNRGCDFLYTCEAETFPEFVTHEEEDCDFYHFGYGKSGFTTFGDYCTTIKLKPEEKQCTKQHGNSGEIAVTGEAHGFHSKCFISSTTLADQSLQTPRPYRCQNYECTDGNLKIFFGNGKSDFVICDSSNQGQSINGPAGYDGQIKCPDNVNEFCLYPVACENYCSKKGYCHRIDGHNECYCIDGYAGETCEIQVQPSQKYIQITGDSTTHVTECAQGYYLDKAANSCKQCHADCSSQFCIGPESNQCTQCNYGKYLDNSQCVDVCSGNQYANKVTRRCEACSDECTMGCNRDADNCLVYPQMYLNHLDYSKGVIDDVYGDDSSVTAAEVEEQIRKQNEEQKQSAAINQFLISIFLIILLALY